MKLTFLAVFLAFAFPVFAQMHFEPGYFITNNGTKTECLIRDIEWKNNPTSFDYRLSEATEVQTGTLGTVLEFFVAGYLFRKFTVDIDRSSNDLWQMSIKKEPELKKETLFLKVLVNGNVTLYSYIDGNIVRYFFAAGKNVPSPLICKPYKVDENVAYNNEFRGQLYLLMKDRMKPGDFKNLRYDEETLVGLFTKYNGGNETTANYSTDKAKGEFRLKFTPGFTLRSLDLTQSTRDFGGSTKYSNKPGFRIGIEAELAFGFNNKKWSIFLDPNIQRYGRMQETETVYPDEVVESRHVWTTDYSFVEVPLGIRHYMYITPKSKVFIDLAYLYALPIGKNDISLQSEGYLNYILTSKASHAAGFAAGLGFASGNFSLEARYSFKRQIFNNYVMWNGQFTALNIIAGYRFL